MTRTTPQTGNPTRPGPRDAERHTTGRETAGPRHRYTARLANEIEEKWQKRWEDEGIFITPNPGDPGFDPSRPKFYILDMFPYPSGAGLHVGHPEGYTATDIVARYRRMRGFNVLHPMGWDAFGLPAEQYAVQTGVHPAKTTGKAIETFRRQLKRFGFSYDWSREFATIDPEYYRWTQWIWLKAYHAWFDPAENRARPIDDLIQDLENGNAYVSPFGELVQPAVEGKIEALGGEPVGMRKWHELTEQERREFIDSHRLAYLDEQMVNWCPRLGTVLANEEVIDGKSERGGYPVHRMPLKQWMFRITAYAERLREGLDQLNWPHSTLTMQREWIGRSDGAEIDFPIFDGDGSSETIRVFTTRPDTVFGATYMVLAPEHPLVDEILRSDDSHRALREYVERARNKSDIERQESREKTGVFTGASAINPATGQRIPIWVADYVLWGYGHGAIMAVPAHDERDFEFAQKFNLPMRKVIEPQAESSDSSKPKPTDSNPWASDDPREWSAAFTGAGDNINSSNEDVSLDGLPTPEAKERIIAWLEKKRIGQRKVNYKLRDWLFSRQRYWGEPFPVVFDEQGNHYPVAEENLPVRLPELEDFRPIESDVPTPPLEKATHWVHTTAGEAGVDPDVLPPETPVRRETNTMPNWAGSCWYYLRFCDPKNQERFVSPEAERYWMTQRAGSSPSPATQGSTHDAGAGDGPARTGIDLYIGGAEHAVLHLLYARFWHRILYDLGYVSTPEPFSRVFHQGLIISYAYRRSDGAIVPADEVEERAEGEFYEKRTGDKVEQITAKMSKSLGNVVNPDDVIADYGADTFRLYEMYMGPLDAAKPWNPRDIHGPFRFLQRIWRLAIDEETGATAFAGQPDETVERALHRTIAKIGADIDRLAFNTAIAAMMEFVNVATAQGGVTSNQMERFTLILSPFAPHIAQEIWHRMGMSETLAFASWPQFDEALIVEESIDIPVQIDGKVRGRITVPADADERAVEDAALRDPKIDEMLGGRTVRKVVVVPGKIVNIVTA